MDFYKKGKKTDLLSTILEQHEEMRAYLNKLDSDDIAAKKFEKLLRKHLILEDSKFYPMLDNELTPQEQDEIFKQFLFSFNEKVKF
jgi:hemerythrin-like domain-containing protein